MREKREEGAKKGALVGRYPLTVNSNETLAG